ncbi:MAG TPA: hypothetical protein VMW65_16305 [Chloroflexota bacterium]|nr:hypothetical protein [Chloroflexota bacterium]
MALVTAGALAGGMLMSSATSAFADYGQGSQYQIEISDNCNGLQSCLAGKGDGIWLWIELNANGTGDYEGTDCLHTGAGGTNGAAQESGNVTWTESNGTLTITGVELLGGVLPAPVTVSATYGHYTESEAQLFPTFPIPGQAQIQVAP